MIRVARRVRQCDGVVNSAVQVARVVHIVAAVAACHAWGPRRRGRGHGGGGPVDACALAEGREPRVALRRRDPGARPPQTTTSLSASFSSRPAVCVKSTMLRGYMPISTRVSSKRMLNIFNQRLSSLYLIQNERVPDEGVEHIPRGSRRAHAVAVVDVLMIRVAIHEDTDRLAQRDRPGSFRFVDVLRRRHKPVPAFWIGCRAIASL